MTLGFLLVPLFSFAAGEVTFTLDETFRSIDPKYTSADYDREFNRVTLSRRLSARAVATATYTDATCDARAIARNANLDLLFPACAKATDGTILVGLQLDPARRTYNGIITHIARNGAITNLPANGNLDGDRDTVLVGFESQSHFLVLRRSNHAWKAWEVTGGAWQEIASSDIAITSFSASTQIAWSGKSWYLLSGSDLSVLYQGLLVPVTSIPRVPTPFSGLASAQNETGMIMRGGSNKTQAHFVVTDDGFFPSQNAEPKDMRTKEPIVWAMLTSVDADVPTGGALIYAVSNDGGKNWQSIDVGREVVFHIEEKSEARKFRWRATLATNDVGRTPAMRKMVWKYTTQNPFPSAVDSRDSRRVSDLQKTKRLVDQVRAETGQAPFVDWFLEAEKQWNRLADILQTVSYTRHLNVRIELPQQNAEQRENFRYHYAGSGNDYVLWVALENPEHRSLKADHDGTLLNVDCNDPVFCLSSVPLPEQPTEERQRSAQPTRKRETPRLVRVHNDAKVWLITENGMRRYVLNLNVLMVLARRHGFRIQEVTRTALERFPENVLLRPDGSNRVYYIWNRNRRWITSAEVFDRYQFTWGDVVAVPIEEINQYRELAPVIQ